MNKPLLGAEILDLIRKSEYNLARPPGLILEELCDVLEELDNRILALEARAAPSDQTLLLIKIESHLAKLGRCVEDGSNHQWLKVNEQRK